MSKNKDLNMKLVPKKSCLIPPFALILCHIGGSGKTGILNIFIQLVILIMPVIMVLGGFIEQDITTDELSEFYVVWISLMYIPFLIHSSVQVGRENKRRSKKLKAEAEKQKADKRKAIQEKAKAEREKVEEAEREKERAEREAYLLTPEGKRETKEKEEAEAKRKREKEEAEAKRKREEEEAKEALYNNLTDISGVSDKLARTLMDKFKTQESIKKASAEDLTSIPGVGLSLAEAIKRRIG